MQIHLFIALNIFKLELFLKKIVCYNDWYPSISSTMHFHKLWWVVSEADFWKIVLLNGTRINKLRILFDSFCIVFLSSLPVSGFVAVRDRDDWQTMNNVNSMSFEVMEYLCPSQLHLLLEWLVNSLL